MTPPLRVGIADDEPLARKRLRALLADRDDVALAVEARNGREAVEAVRRAHAEHAPLDLLLLDVEMPELDGLGAVSELAAEERPAVVFVTAYDRYAVQAFELHALDYVLKPFDDDRFHEALDRAAERRRGGDEDALTDRTLSLLRPPADETPADFEAEPTDADAPDRLRRVAVRTGDRFHLVDADDIDWVEGAGVYVRLVTGEKSHLLRTNLADLERRLDPATFLRVHRSSIVNLDRVREVRVRPHGEYVLVLEDGTRLKVSRTYSDRVRAYLGTLI